MTTRAAVDDVKAIGDLMAEDGISLQSAVLAVVTPEQIEARQLRATWQRRGRLLASLSADLVALDVETGVSARRGAIASERVADRMSAAADGLSRVTARLDELITARHARENGKP